MRAARTHPPTPPSRFLVHLSNVLADQLFVLIPNELLFKEGDGGTDMYFVNRGEVSASPKSASEWQQNQSKARLRSLCEPDRHLIRASVPLVPQSARHSLPPSPSSRLASHTHQDNLVQEQVRPGRHRHEGRGDGAEKMSSRRLLRRDGYHQQRRAFGLGGGGVLQRAVSGGGATAKRSAGSPSLPHPPTHPPPPPTGTAYVTTDGRLASPSSSSSPSPMPFSHTHNPSHPQLLS